MPVTTLGLDGDGTPWYSETLYEVTSRQFVPHQLTWTLEAAEAPTRHGGYWTLERFADLPALLGATDAGSAQASTELASSDSGTAGRAPTWEMTSAAASDPSRPQCARPNRWLSP